MKRALAAPASVGTPYVSWELFKELFNDKYFPLNLRMAKEREFMDLKQTRDMNVAQYEDSFTRLIKYMPIYESEERIKAQNFLGGLKLRVQKALSNIRTESYAEVVQQAMAVEANWDRIDSIQGANQQASNPKSSSGKKLDPKKAQFKPNKSCVKCGKLHTGRPCRQGMSGCYTCGDEGHLNRDCPKKGRTICFNCHQSGHFSNDCPKPRPSGQFQAPALKSGTQQGRVFNLTRQDTAEDPAVIQGTMFISGLPMHVLIDSGASHSFISHAYSEVLGEKPKNLDCRMIVATPMGKSLETSSGYKNKKIQIGETEFLVYLILLEF